MLIARQSGLPRLSRLARWLLVLLVAAAGPQEALSYSDLQVVPDARVPTNGIVWFSRQGLEGQPPGQRLSQRSDAVVRVLLVRVDSPGPEIRTVRTFFWKFGELDEEVLGWKPENDLAPNAAYRVIFRRELPEGAGLRVPGSFTQEQLLAEYHNRTAIIRPGAMAIFDRSLRSDSPTPTWMEVHYDSLAWTFRTSAGPAAPAPLWPRAWRARPPAGLFQCATGLVALPLALRRELKTRTVVMAWEPEDGDRRQRRWRLLQRGQQTAAPACTPAKDPSGSLYLLNEAGEAAGPPLVWKP